MAKYGRLLRCGIGAGCCVLASVCSSADVSTASAPEAVVLMNASSLVEHRLPAVVSVANGRFLQTRLIERACARSIRADDGLLLFFPDTDRCERVRDQDLVSLRQRLHAVTGRWIADPLLDVQEKTFVPVVPAAISPNDVLVMCGCSVDQAPEGTASCSEQTRTVGATIGSVEFDATDADTPTLSGQFSYQLNTNPAEQGLPPGITSSCTNGTGTLQCTLSGTAPAPAGDFQLTLDVSDGTFTLPLETQINVLASGDRIFADNFEAAGCP